MSGDNLINAKIISSDDPVNPFSFKNFLDLVNDKQEPNAFEPKIEKDFLENVNSKELVEKLKIERKVETAADYFQGMKSYNFLRL
jgi:hypothetical protein